MKVAVSNPNQEPGLKVKKTDDENPKRGWKLFNRKYKDRPSTPYELQDEIDALEDLGGHSSMMRPSWLDYEVGNLRAQQGEAQQAALNYNKEVRERQARIEANQNMLMQAMAPGMDINNLTFSEGNIISTGYLDEKTPRVSDYIDSMFGTYAGTAPGHGKQESGSGPAWSAVTVSALVDGYYDSWPKVSAAHADYIRHALRGGTPLQATELDTKTFEPKVGQILFRGRDAGKGGNTSRWKYKDFAKTAMKSNNFFPSHGDVITYVGEDDGGKFVVIAGGNVGNKFAQEKIYTSEITKSRRGRAPYVGIIHDDSNMPIAE